MLKLQPAWWHSPFIKQADDTQPAMLSGRLILAPSNWVLLEVI